MEISLFGMKWDGKGTKTLGYWSMNLKNKGLHGWPIKKKERGN